MSDLYKVDNSQVVHACCWDTAVVRVSQDGKVEKVICDTDETQALVICALLNDYTKKTGVVL